MNRPRFTLKAMLLCVFLLCVSFARLAVLLAPSLDEIVEQQEKSYLDEVLTRLNGRYEISDIKVLGPSDMEHWPRSRRHKYYAIGSGKSAFEDSPSIDVFLVSVGVDMSSGIDSDSPFDFIGAGIEFSSQLRVPCGDAATPEREIRWQDASRKWMVVHEYDAQSTRASDLPGYVFVGWLIADEWISPPHRFDANFLESIVNPNTDLNDVRGNSFVRFLFLRVVVSGQFENSDDAWEEAKLIFENVEQGYPSDNSPFAKSLADRLRRSIGPSTLP